MIYLFLAIVSSSFVALILKLSESRSLNRYAVTSFNYLIAFLLGLVLACFGTNSFGILDQNLASSVQTFSSEFFDIIISNEGKFSESATLIWLIISGSISGVFYFLGFICIQKSIKANGVGLTGAFSKLGIFVPMLLAIFLWNEIPGLLKIIGILLAVTAMILSNVSLKEFNNFKSFKLLLILTLITVGLSEFSNKIFEKYTILEFRGLFLSIIFLTAGIISLVFTLFSRQNKRKISWYEVIVGLCVGIPNFFTSYFIIRALKDVMTTVAFPIYSSGSIILIGLGGVIIFKEKLSTNEKLAILVIVIAIVLMTV